MTCDIEQVSSFKGYSWVVAVPYEFSPFHIRDALILAAAPTTGNRGGVSRAPLFTLFANLTLL